MKYTCTKCKEEFISDRPDEEAMKEYQQYFTWAPKSEPKVIICDNCWNIIMRQ